MQVFQPQCSLHFSNFLCIYVSFRCLLHKQHVRAFYICRRWSREDYVGVLQPISITYLRHPRTLWKELVFYFNKTGKTSHSSRKKAMVHQEDYKQVKQRINIFLVHFKHAFRLFRTWLWIISNILIYVILKHDSELF